MGCASTTDVVESNQQSCPRYIDIKSVLSLKHDEIICQGEFIQIQCELLYGIESEDRKACKGYTSTIVTYLNRNSLREGYYLSISDVLYSDEGICIDTFIPGREAADCFDFIRVSIPIRKK